MLRVWTKWYKAFNTGQISVLGSAMWGWTGCTETDRQKLNNLIFSPLFTCSPALPLSCSHFLTFVFPLLPALPLTHSQASSFLASPLLYLISSSHGPRLPSILSSPLPSSRSLSTLSWSSHLHAYSRHKDFNSDRKYWSTHCSGHKDVRLKLITSFFKQRTPGKHGFASFNSTFVEQTF